MKNTLTLFALTLVFVANAQQSKLFVGRGYTNGVYVLDAATLDSLAFIETAGGYRMVLVDTPDGLRIYSSSGSDFVSVIDVETNSLIENIYPAGSDVYELEGITTYDGVVYVADESYDVLLAIDTDDNSTLMNVSTDTDEPENLVMAGDGQFIYMADNSDVLKFSADELSLLDWNAASGDCHAIAIDEQAQFVYGGGNQIIKYETATMDALDTLEWSSYYMQHLPGQQKLLTVDEGSSFAVLNTATMEIENNTVLSSYGARGIAFDSDFSTYYVAASQGVYALDGTTLAVADSIVGFSAQSLVYVPAPVSVSETMDSNNARIFPNPNNGSFRLNYPSNQTATISVCNSLGALVYQTKYAGQQQIQINSLRDGIYTLILSSGAEIFRQQFVVAN